MNTAAYLDRLFTWMTVAHTNLDETRSGLLTITALKKIVYSTCRPSSSFFQYPLLPEFWTDQFRFFSFLKICMYLIWLKNFVKPFIAHILSELSFNEQSCIVNFGAKLKFTYWTWTEKTCKIRNHSDLKYFLVFFIFRPTPNWCTQFFELTGLMSSEAGQPQEGPGSWMI